MKWKDPRLTFKNLKETGNYLEKSLLDQIWLPKLHFVNTKGNLQVLVDDSMTVQVLREGINHVTEGNHQTSPLKKLPFWCECPILNKCRK